MKRKYAALVLGLTLAISSTAVYAEQTEAVSEEIILEESADTSEELSDAEDFIMEDNDATEEVYGRVTAIDETSITIELGTVQYNMEKPEGEAPEGAEIPMEEASDASSSAEDAAAKVTDDVDLTAEEENAEATDALTEADVEEDLNESDAENPVPEELPEGEVPEGQPMGDGKGISLEFNGVNQIISITDDTVAVAEEPILEMLEELEEMLPDEESADAEGTDTLAEAGDELTEEDGDAENTLAEASSEEDALAESDSEEELAEAENIDTNVTVEDAEATELPEDLDLIMIPAYEESETTEINLSDIEIDSYVKITLDEDGNAAVITVLPVTEPAQS